MNLLKLQQEEMCRSVLVVVLSLLALSSADESPVPATAPPSPQRVQCEQGEWCIIGIYSEPVVCPREDKPPGQGYCPDLYKRLNVTAIPLKEGCKKFGTYAPFVDYATKKSTEQHPIPFWGCGRLDMTAPSTTLEVSYYGNNVCYCEVTWQYDLWWSLMVAGFSSGLLWTFYCYWAIREMDGSKMAFSPQFVAIYLNILAPIIRLIWLGSVYNGRGMPMMFDEATNAALVLFPEILLYGEFLLIILVWRSVVTSVQKMKNHNKEMAHAADQRKYQRAGIMITLMCVTIVPGNMAGRYLRLPILSDLADLSMLIITLLLITGGIIYARSLTAILRGNAGTKNKDDKMDQRKKDAISAILNAVMFSTFLAVVVIASVLINIIARPRGPVYLLWGYWAPIHISEFLLMYTLATSVSQKARISLKERNDKRGERLFDSGSNNSSGTENASHKSGRPVTNKLEMKEFANPIAQ